LEGAHVVRDRTARNAGIPPGDPQSVGFSDRREYGLIGRPPAAGYPAIASQGRGFSSTSRRVVHVAASIVFSCLRVLSPTPDQMWAMARRFGVQAQAPITLGTRQVNVFGDDLDGHAARREPRRKPTRSSKIAAPRNAAFSRLSSFSPADSSVVVPGREPTSTSAASPAPAAQAETSSTNWLRWARGLFSNVSSGVSGCFLISVNWEFAIMSYPV
jgi:hypothetical protein